MRLDEAAPGHPLASSASRRSPSRSAKKPLPACATLRIFHSPTPSRNSARKWEHDENTATPSIPSGPAVARFTLLKTGACQRRTTRPPMLAFQTSPTSRLGEGKAAKRLRLSTTAPKRSPSWPRWTLTNSQGNTGMNRYLTPNSRAAAHLAPSLVKRPTGQPWTASRCEAGRFTSTAWTVQNTRPWR